MSRIFGPIRQNGVVVPDMDRAITHWSETMGVGPWYVFDRVVTHDAYHRGEPSTLALKIALSYSGGVQIELIEQLDDTPSIYLDFLRASGGVGGLQHVSSWPTPDEFDHLIETCRRSGPELVWHGHIGSTRFGYADTTANGGTMFEFADLAPETKVFFSEIEKQAADWDGTDPIRRI